jgi:hypothetical protein
MDDVEISEHVIEKKEREPENGNSNDKFAEIKAAAAFRIHASPAILRMVTFSTHSESLSRN